MCRVEQDKTIELECLESCGRLVLEHGTGEKECLENGLPPPTRIGGPAWLTLSNLDRNINFTVQTILIYLDVLLLWSYTSSVNTW